LQELRSKLHEDRVKLVTESYGSRDEHDQRANSRLADLSG
jgi:hypothetical protein